MHANRQRALPAASASLVTTLAALLTITPAPATHAATKPPITQPPSVKAKPGSNAPQLSIAVDDGRTSASPGDKLTYTITVRNLGTTNVTGLGITQTLPTGQTFTSADSAGITKEGSVSWRLDLKVDGKAALHTTTTVPTTSKEVLRLATVACANKSATKPPIVCASHSDLLPAGASAQTAMKKISSTSSSTAQPWWYLASGIGAISLIIGALAVLITRRHKAPQPS